MENVKNKRCQKEGCKKQPIYNCNGQTKAIYCGGHKLEYMENI